MLPPPPEGFSKPHEAVVLGLSGGRDSVALLRLLTASGVPVYACHVHHGIRGAEADADADFCRQLCAELCVPYAEYRTDVPTLAEQHRESVETAARTERRRILARHAAALGVHAVALAHHAEDQAETILFNLARGGAGLRGMLPERTEAGLRWLRPLLFCRRTQITAWLQALQQPWREDSTNSCPADATRNALRLHVLPELCRAMGRDVIPAILRAARLQAQTSAALETALQVIPYKDPQGRLYLPLLEGKPAAFRQAVISTYLREAGIRDLTARHIQGVCEILSPDAPCHSYNLPGNIRALRAHKRLHLVRRRRAQEDAGRQHTPNP